MAALVNPALLVIPALFATAGLTVAVTNEGDAFVERVIDGDTVVLGDGSTVRLIGIDAPEAGEPCSERATEELRRMVEGRVVTLGNPESVRDEDRYGRLLRYIDANFDPSTSLLTDGLATARYDSTDGYEPHPRQALYHALEAGALAACPTLNRDSRWYVDPDGYLKHLEDRHLERERREQQAQQARERREQQARERREQQAREERERREAARREAERREYERERGSQDSGPEQPDGGYTGPRCYAPGGQTWTPC